MHAADMGQIKIVLKRYLSEWTGGPKETNGGYVGTENCVACHEESAKIWRKSEHCRAFSVLEHAEPPRNYDPECISCHVVGWNPGKFFPYETGYLNEKKTPKLINVGCEDCHGPGQAHVQAESGHDAALQKAARKTVAITEAEAADPTSKRQNCYSCHDLDNSPEFNFKTYFPLIEHHESE